MYEFNISPYKIGGGGPLPGSPTASYWSTPSLSEAAGGGVGGEQGIGFLPNFHGDKFTNPQRIQVNLNRGKIQYLGHSLAISQRGNCQFRKAIYHLKAQSVLYKFGHFFKANKIPALKSYMSLSGINPNICLLEEKPLILKIILTFQKTIRIGHFLEDI